MPVECCGLPRTSRFCPDCGKALADSALLELLAWCRSSEKNYRTRAKTNRNVDRDRTYGKPNDQERRADEWKRWGDALEAFVSERTELVVLRSFKARYDTTGGSLVDP